MTREAFIDILETTKNFDTGVTFSISYNKDNHEGTTETEIVKVGPDLKWQTVAQSGGK